MLRILDRYILREVAVTWLAVTGVLLAILLTNQIARVLERAAESQYPRGVVLELIMLGAVQNLALIVPVGLLLGIVLGLGRLYHDSEMTAAQACGAQATGYRVGPSDSLRANPQNSSVMRRRSMYKLASNSPVRIRCASCCRP